MLQVSFHNVAQEAKMECNNAQQQNEYRLDPEIAASLRRPIRADLTPRELAELKRLNDVLEQLQKNTTTH